MHALYAVHGDGASTCRSHNVLASHTVYGTYASDTWSRWFIKAARGEKGKTAVTEGEGSRGEMKLGGDLDDLSHWYQAVRKKKGSSRETLLSREKSLSALWYSCWLNEFNQSQWIPETYRLQHTFFFLTADVFTCQTQMQQITIHLAAFHSGVPVPLSWSDASWLTVLARYRHYI